MYKLYNIPFSAFKQKPMSLQPYLHTDNKEDLRHEINFNILADEDFNKNSETMMRPDIVNVIATLKSMLTALQETHIPVKFAFDATIILFLRRLYPGDLSEFEQFIKERNATLNYDVCVEDKVSQGQQAYVGLSSFDDSLFEGFKGTDFELDVPSPEVQTLSTGSPQVTSHKKGTSSFFAAPASPVVTTKMTTRASESFSSRSTRSSSRRKHGHDEVSESSETSVDNSEVKSLREENKRLSDENRQLNLEMSKVNPYIKSLEGSNRALKQENQQLKLKLKQPTYQVEDSSTTNSLGNR